MTELERECGVFCRALIEQDAPPALRSAYARAHEIGAVGRAASAFDRFLAKWAAASPSRARFADSYAVLFAPGSLLRRKLVLALALVESHAQTSRIADAPTPGNSSLFIARTAFASLAFVLRAGLAALIFTPARLILHFVGKE